VDNTSINVEIDEPAHHESACPPTPRNQSDSSMQSVPPSTPRETGLDSMILFFSLLAHLINQCLETICGVPQVPIQPTNSSCFNETI
jgi:hypothetical protein